MAKRPRREMNRGGDKAIARDAPEERHKSLETALDDALENTFPASDPISMEQPVPPAPDRDGS
jgi:hypothetical protein